MDPKPKAQKEISSQYGEKYTYLHIPSITGNEHRRNLQCFKTRLLAPYQTVPSGKYPFDVKLSQLLLEAVG